MNIVIDCRMILASGIGIYLKGILSFIFGMSPDHTKQNNFLLLGNPAQLAEYTSYRNTVVIPYFAKPFSIKELLFINQKVIQRINKSDVYYSPYINIPSGIVIPVFITIHDIIFPDMPELTSKIGLAVRMWFYRRAYKQAKKIFTVSEFSRSRIEYHLGKKKQIIIAHAAARSEFVQYKNQLKEHLKDETIIFIGNIKKHKGIDCLIDAFIMAKKEGLPHRLIIIGSIENFHTKDNFVLQKINNFDPASVIFTGYIPNEKLMEYITRASLLIQPSYYEGFGIPPLESMVLGTRVLISDIPVFKEIYNEFPVTFFKVGDSSDLKNKTISLLQNKQQERLLLSEALMQKFNFADTAKIILKELQ